MCKILKISRSIDYSYEESEAKKDKINVVVIKIFNENQHVYGTRKLKVEHYIVSRRRIARIMLLMDWCRPTRSKNTDLIRTM